MVKTLFSAENFLKSAFIWRKSASKTISSLVFFSGSKILLESASEYCLRGKLGKIGKPAVPRFRGGAKPKITFLPKFYLSYPQQLTSSTPQKNSPKKGAIMRFHPKYGGAYRPTTRYLALPQRPPGASTRRPRSRRYAAPLGAATSFRKF